MMCCESRLSRTPSSASARAKSTASSSGWNCSLDTTCRSLVGGSFSAIGGALRGQEVDEGEPVPKRCDPLPASLDLLEVDAFEGFYRRLEGCRSPIRGSCSSSWAW